MLFRTQPPYLKKAMKFNLKKSLKKLCQLLTAEYRKARGEIDVA